VCVLWKTVCRWSGVAGQAGHRAVRKAERHEGDRRCLHVELSLAVCPRYLLHRGCKGRRFPTSDTEVS
jgi:hypothetical protein